MTEKGYHGQVNKNNDSFQSNGGGGGGMIKLDPTHVSSATLKKSFEQLCAQLQRERERAASRQVLFGILYGKAPSLRSDGIYAEQKTCIICKEPKIVDSAELCVLCRGIFLHTTMQAELEKAAQAASLKDLQNKEQEYPLHGVKNNLIQSAAADQMALRDYCEDAVVVPSGDYHGRVDIEFDVAFNPQAARRANLLLEALKAHLFTSLELREQLKEIGLTYKTLVSDEGNLKLKSVEIDIHDSLSLDKKSALGVEAYLAAYATSEFEAWEFLRARLRMMAPFVEDPKAYRIGP